MALKVGKICTKKERGEGKKALWPEVGVLFYAEDEDRINIQLNMYPDTKFYVFWNDEKKAPF